MSVFKKPSGIDPGQRQLFGTQTTGRQYRNLSAAQYTVARDQNVSVPMRDGVHLHVDVYRPEKNAEKFPALLALSPFPRQLQPMGIPAGFIESGQSDFFVPRGYVHVIANSRGTCGSEGTYSFWGEAEQYDLYDLIEWIAIQPWCNGKVGMIGVSYFAMEQLRAALQAPPHLKAIFPFSATTDVYREIFWHGGMFSARFAERFFIALGMLSKVDENFFRSEFFTLLNKVLKSKKVHQKLAAPHEDTLKVFELAMRFHYDTHPWDDLIQQVGIEHQLYDDFWKARTLSTRIHEIKIPMYMGADWENVCLHLDTPFMSINNVDPSTPFKMCLAPRGSLQWPWETLHIEALAWYDHWLKDQDTGIMEGPRIRYFVPGAEQWRESDTWPLPETQFTPWYLQSDGVLGKTSDAASSRDYLQLPESLGFPKNVNKPALPNQLCWMTPAFQQPIELIGPFKLSLHASCTAIDTDWLVKLQLVDVDSKTQDLTQGWLRASHRALDPEKSTPYRPHHFHDRVEPLIPFEPTWFEIAVLPTAQRFQPGQRLALILTSQDEHFSMQGILSDTLNLPTRNTIYGDSVLLVPIVP